MAERVRALASAGRLQLGPWYTQPDMLISSGEELVRNLQIGIRTAQEAGGAMMFGHTADNFGFCVQLPQIYREFGIDRASLYRGPQQNADYHRTIFNWQALDGSGVHVANLVGPAGYLLFTWPFDAPGLPEAYFLRAQTYLKRRGVTDRYLLMAGSDAMEPRADLPLVLNRLEREFPGNEFRIATLDEYMDDALASNPQIPSYCGMLRSRSGCQGSISARLDLKRWNAEAYTVLEHYAEPYGALAWLVAGRRYPGSAIERGWKFLCENLTHDDMAGYSTEEVYVINRGRYVEARNIGIEAAVRGMKTVFERVRTPDKSDLLNKPLVVFNPLPWQRTDVVDLNFTMTNRGRLHDPFAEGGYHTYIVTDLDGNSVPAAVTRNRGYFRIRFLASDVPSMGYKTYVLHTRSEGRPAPAVTDSTVLENEFVRLSFCEDGRFDLLDKETGASYPGLHYFEDRTTPRGSALYFNESRECSTTIGHRAELTLVENTPLCRTMRVRWNDWRIPFKPGAGQLVPMPVTSYISIHAGVRRVDIYTEVENNAKRHILRAAFPVPARPDSFALGVQFGMMTAPVRGRADNRPVGQWEQTIHPQQDWSDISDGTKGLAVLSRGTPVISVRAGEGDSTTLALLPMLRASQGNGGDFRLSAPANRFRPRVTGDEVSQMFGLQSASYSIVPHSGDWQQANVDRQAKNAAVRLWAETLTLNDPPKWQIGPYGFPSTYVWPEGDMPSEQSFLSIEPEGVHLSAFKRAEQGDALIMRIFNTTADSKNVSMNFFRPATNVQAVNMLEEQAEGLPEVTWNVEDGRTRIGLTLPPFRIVTLRVAVEPAPAGSWPQMSY